MLRQLLLGGAVSLGNIAIHAAVMATVVGTARRALEWERQRPQSGSPPSWSRPSGS